MLEHQFWDLEVESTSTCKPRSVRALASAMVKGVLPAPPVERLPMPTTGKRSRRTGSAGVPSRLVAQPKRQPVGRHQGKKQLAG